MKNGSDDRPFNFAHLTINLPVNMACQTGCALHVIINEAICHSCPATAVSCQFHKKLSAVKKGENIFFTCVLKLRGCLDYKNSSAGFFQENSLTSYFLCIKN